MAADYDANELAVDIDASTALNENTAGGDSTFPLPVAQPIPLLLTASGLYSFTRSIKIPPIPPIPPVPVSPLPGRRPGPVAATEPIYADDVNAITLYQREELRLDVDGRFPQMTVSGTRSGLVAPVASWVASLTNTGTNTYSGPIWFKDGNVNAVPHTQVSLKVTKSLLAAQRKVEATFSGGGAAAFTRTYVFESASFHPVEFEFDTVAGAANVTEIGTHDHPNRPGTLANETLNLQTVYRRAGLNATVSPGSGGVPISGAGANARWSDQEMHDAMQIYWSRFANKAQWSLWVLFASLHEQGTSLGGIMFDDIGPNHRQGTAIFSDAFIATPPAGDPNPAAWVKRMRFWTAAHEMGHAFNLAHSWQKASTLPTGEAPWIPLANDPEARSFMNYPYNVAGGQSAFFANFAYRFSDPELLFMRHAPERFVEMGNADWFDHHGFEQVGYEANDEFALTLSVNAADNRLPYLLAPVVEMALVNRSGRSRTVSASRLSERKDLILVIKKDGKPARQWLPYSHHCGEEEGVVVEAGQALYDSVLVGAGRNGWDMAEPGRYTVQAMLSVDGRVIVSNPLEVKVSPPNGREEEKLAQDVFIPEVGQVLAVNGTRAVERAAAALGAVASLGDHPAAKQAAIALAVPLATEFKLLQVDERAKPGHAPPEAARRIETYGPDQAEAARLLSVATGGGADQAVDAVGHTRFIRVASKLAAAVSNGVAAKQDGRMGLSAMRAGEATQDLGLSDEMQRILKVKASGMSA